MLFALPTAQLASRMRERYGRCAGLDIDTCHAAFGLNEAAAGELPFLVAYDMIVVDEVSQLTMEHSDRVLRLWQAADKLPALVCVGDRWQMSGFGDQRPWQSNLWKKATFKTEFIHSYRCQDPAFEKLLKQLRTSKPDKKTLRQLQRRKAWAPPGPPTPDAGFSAHIPTPPSSPAQGRGRRKSTTAPWRPCLKEGAAGRWLSVWRETWKQTPTTTLTAS